MYVCRNQLPVSFSSLPQNLRTIPDHFILPDEYDFSDIQMYPAPQLYLLAVSLDR